MPTIVKPVLVSALLLLALGACSRSGGGGHDEMTWAREALERNDHLQVVAADADAKTFTVKLKESGQLLVIPLDQLVAGPAAAMEPSSKQAAAASPPQAPAPPATAPESSPSSAPQSAPPAQAPGGSALASAGDQAESNPPPMPDSAKGGGYAYVPPAAGPHAESAANARAGSVLAAGPGYSIKATGSQAGAQRSSPLTAARGTPVEKLHDPIICQGSRLLHIDNRNLEFDGDAVGAEDGCEIYITNTHITAKGIGVLARAANVHIENSEIEGDSGAIDASDGAQVYAESSRFKGLTRRLEASAFHDLGGNVWN
jgi:hypothetical protein